MHRQKTSRMNGNFSMVVTFLVFVLVLAVLFVGTTNLSSAAGEEGVAATYKAIERAAVYADAGADGFFAPGLRKPAFVQQVADASPLPLNILVMADTPTNAELASCGVSRISYGPGPYKQMIEFLKASAVKIYAPK